MAIYLIKDITNDEQGKRKYIDFSQEELTSVAKYLEANKTRYHFEEYIHPHIGPKRYCGTKGKAINLIPSKVQLQLDIQDPDERKLLEEIILRLEPKYIIGQGDHKPQLIPKYLNLF